MEEKNEDVKRGRPKKPASANRVKHTTAIDANLIKWVKIFAIEKGVTTADIIEEALFSFKIRNTVFPQYIDKEF